MAGKILFVMHSRKGGPGEVGEALDRLGFETEIRRPVVGDALPGHHEDYAACVIFGGPQSANDIDCEDYMRREAGWIEGRLASGKPMLGICLGCQLIARVLGAPVTRHAEGLREIGFYPITPTDAGRGMFDEGLHVYHWHKEGWELPPGAELLARGETFPNQAFRYRETVYGIQFHPEVNRRIMSRWIELAGEDLEHPGAQSAEEQNAGCSAHEARMHGWLEGFLARWLDVADR